MSLCHFIKNEVERINVNIYKKTTIFITIILNYQSTIFFAGTYEMVSQKSDHGISLKAEDFPILVEGFQLCGRYDLQEFIDQKLQVLNPVIQNDLPDNVNESPNVFTHITEPAQAVIIDILSQDKISAEKFYTTLNKIIKNHLDLDDASAGSYFCCTRYPENQLFQYCIRVDFMRPVIKKYLIYCDSKSRTKDHLEFWHAAFYYNQPQIIELYINCSDVYKDALQNKFGYAVNYHADKIIPILAAGDKNINKQDTQGNTSLHHVVCTTTTDTFDDLLRCCCVRSASNNKLILALIAAGADLQIRNNEGKRPWDLAESEKIRDLLQPTSAQSTQNDIINCIIS